MQKKALFFAGAVLCLLAAGWGYYQYQKPRAGTSGIRPDYEITAAQLYTEYSSNEAGADKKYNNKVLQVTGAVKEVQNTAQAVNILLAGNAMGGVNCSFEKSPERPITAGEQITVKGRCTGFLMDVSLVDAVQTDK